jgi:hypothetical protein
MRLLFLKKVISFFSSIELLVFHCDDERLQHIMAHDDTMGLTSKGKPQGLSKIRSALSSDQSSL